MEPLSSSEEFIETLVGANFKQNVHILRIFKKVEEVDNVNVLD